MRPTFRLHESTQHRVRFFFSLDGGGVVDEELVVGGRLVESIIASSPTDEQSWLDEDALEVNVGGSMHEAEIIAAAPAGASTADSVILTAIGAAVVSDVLRDCMAIGWVVVVDSIGVNVGVSTVVG